MPGITTALRLAANGANPRSAVRGTQAAVVTIAKDPAWRVWDPHWAQRAEHPLPRKAAPIAVACKRLRVAWACARQQTPYDARRLTHAWGMAG